MREPLTVYRKEFAEIEYATNELREKLWVLMEQMEEYMEEFRLEDPSIAKEYGKAYDMLEAFATSVSIEFDDYKDAIKRGMENG